MDRRAGGSVTVSLLSGPAMLIEWCWTIPRPTRRRRRVGGTIRLGGKRRRSLAVRFRPVVRWKKVVMGPLRKLKRLIFEIASHGGLFYWSFPFVYPLAFPLT